MLKCQNCINYRQIFHFTLSRQLDHFVHFNSNGVFLTNPPFFFLALLSTKYHQHNSSKKKKEKKDHQHNTNKQKEKQLVSIHLTSIPSQSDR